MVINFHYKRMSYSFYVVQIIQLIEEFEAKAYAMYAQYLFNQIAEVSLVMSG